MAQPFKEIFSPKYRVAYFAGSMRPGIDGVTRVLYKLIEELNVRGIENIFISPIIPPKDEQPTAMFKVPSVTVPFYKEYRLPYFGQKKFEKKLLEFKPDIIHINSPCPLGYAALKFGLKHSIPVVATYHTHFASYAKYYKVKSLESFSWNYFRSLYNRCESVYVPSIPILNELREHGLTSTEFLPHGVDTQTFNPGFKSSDWKRNLGIEDKTALLFAGRLVWEKDLQTFADVYKILSAKRNDIAFVLAGDGPIREDLKKIMPEAKFLGYQTGSELSTTYASSDIFVFPSTTETFGNVTVEAMASGIPPICVKEGGAYGIIKDGVTGLIAEPRNAEDISDKIEKLLDQPELRNRIALQALEYAQTQSWKNVFDRLFKSYEEVIHNYSVKELYKQKRVA
ncbi:MAG: glycosyltransferase family 4 protein [Ignavibacteriaceae bacterium]